MKSFETSRPEKGVAVVVGGTSAREPSAFAMSDGQGEDEGRGKETNEPWTFVLL